MISSPAAPVTRRAERSYYQLAIALVVFVTVTAATSTIKDLKDGNYVDMAAGFAVTIIAATVVEFLLGALKRR